MRNQSGFTIFELAVVIAIIAVLASIAVPSMMGMLPNHRMTSAADELVSAIWLAQKRAVRDNSDVAVNFNFGNESYVVCMDTSGDANCDGGEQIIKSVQVSGGIDLANIDLGNFRFDRRGFAFDTAGNPASGRISVSNGTTSQNINMTAAGNCIIQNP